jgi:glycosyltransferase involved in cell wall biosynthesis
MVKESVPPQISIITIAKDNEAGLQKTLDSLLKQDFSLWELILVVGKSVDGTEAQAQAFEATNQRIVVLTQQDSGIYQAMNLGVMAAETDYVWFMNAGDTFHGGESLRIGATQSKAHNCGLLIGHHQIQGSSRVFKNPIGRLKVWNLAFSRRGSCHQAMIFKTSLLRTDPTFDVRFRYAADYKLALEVVGLGGGFRISDVLCEVEPGGVSDINLSEVHREKHEIRREILGDGLWNRAFSRLWIFLLFSKVSLRNATKRVRGFYLSRIA